MRKTRNVRMIAENIDNIPGFDIYLDFSGRREYLTSHRHNGKLYGILQRGVYLDEMRRMNTAKLFHCSGHLYGNKSVSRLQDTLDRLIREADRYISERSA